MGSWNMNRRDLTVRQVEALGNIKTLLKGGEIFTSEEFDSPEYGWMSTLRGTLREYGHLMDLPKEDQDEFWGTPEKENESPEELERFFTDREIQCLAEVRKLLDDLDLSDSESSEDVMMASNVSGEMFQGLYE